MRVRFTRIALAAACGLGLPAGAPAAEPPAPDAAATIEAAVQAHGGEAALRQWQNMDYEGQATFTWGTMEVQGTAKVIVRDGKMLRRERKITFRGTPMETVEAATGKSAWQRRRSRVYDHPVDDFNTWLSRRPDILLRAAAAPAERLKYVGAGDIEGDPVILVDFEEPEGTTRILFDAETRLVRGLEYKALSHVGDGNPEEVFFKKTYADYRPADGVPFPRRLEEYRKGTRQVLLEVTRVALGRPPEVALFAKPEADEEAKEWSDQIAN